MFQRTGQIWAQQAYVKPSNTHDHMSFGSSIALSGDTLAVGANLESGLAARAGAVYVFTRSVARWTQQAYLHASNAEADDQFGFSVAISGDQLIAGAIHESSIATGVNGNQSDNSALRSGAAYWFTRSAATWTQQAYLKASNTEPATFTQEGIIRNAGFGASVSVSGTTLVVGASGESSGSAGFNGNQADNSKSRPGAIYVFQH